MSPTGRIGRLAREPLVYFVAAGAVLFLLGADRARLAGSERTEIVVAASEVELLRDGFRRRWQRDPSATELEEMLAERVRDEVLAREALAQGLDRDDPVVRRRLRQKLELVAENARRPAEPEPGELEAFLAEHADRYRSEPASSDVLDAVRLDWEVTRAAAAAEAHYRELRARYEVRVEWPRDPAARENSAR